MRDISIGDTIDIKFCTTEPDTGAPATLSGTPVVSAYVGNSTTQITAGITLSVDFDGVTGLNNVRVAATTGNGYTDGTDVSLVITTGTVDGNSAVGYVIENFTIGRSAANTSAKALARAAYLVDTTIATLSSQTSFTLTAGSADNDAYNGMAFLFTDAGTATQKGVAFCSDYAGSTKTVTLEAAPIFTIATSDLVTVVPAGSSTSVPFAVKVTDWDGSAADEGLRGALGLASADLDTQLSTIDTNVDAVLVDTGTTLPASLATIDSNVDAILVDTGTTLDGKLDTIDNFLDTEIAAIKAKTDQLTFTKTNEIDANIQSINGVTITGDGGTGTEFDI